MDIVFPKFCALVLFLSVTACSLSSGHPGVFVGQGAGKILNRNDLKSIHFAGSYTLYFDRNTGNIFGYSASSFKYDPRVVKIRDNLNDIKSEKNLPNLVCNNFTKCNYSEHLCRFNFSDSTNPEIVENYFQSGGFPVNYITYEKRDSVIKYEIEYYNECQYLKKDVEQAQMYFSNSR